jgi:hypothetical protein
MVAGGHDSGASGFQVHRRRGDEIDCRRHTRAALAHGCGVGLDAAPTTPIQLLRRFFFFHRVRAALRAISLRRFAEIVFIRTFADLRPIAEKYSESFLSIILHIVYYAAEHQTAPNMRLSSLSWEESRNDPIEGFWLSNPLHKTLMAPSGVTVQGFLRRGFSPPSPG